MRRVAITATLVAGQGEYIVMLFGTDMSAMGGLIMRSAGMAVMRSRCLLTTLVHREHGATMSGSGDLGWFDVDLYLLTGALILIIVDCVTDVGSEVVLGIFAGLCTWPTKGPSIPKSCACITRCRTHCRQSRHRQVSLTGRSSDSSSSCSSSSGVDNSRFLCQCIFCANFFH